MQGHRGILLQSQFRRSDGLMAMALAAWLVLPGMALADPCGMVPPIYVNDNTSLVRVGDEQTYVFHKDGVETFVIRPGFKGKVEDFGMLISFPAPPALRKVSEDIFPQVAAAIDPPEVVIDLRRGRDRNYFAFNGGLVRQA